MIRISKKNCYTMLKLLHKNSKKASKPIKSTLKLSKVYIVNKKNHAHDKRNES